MIRLYALHDDTGNISGLISAPDDAPRATISVQPGVTVTEVDASAVDIDIARDGGEVHERLLNLMNHYQLDTAAGRGLIKRTFPPAKE
jgi:hypothetical protein